MKLPKKDYRDLMDFWQKKTFQMEHKNTFKCLIHKNITSIAHLTTTAKGPKKQKKQNEEKTSGNHDILNWKMKGCILQIGESTTNTIHLLG